MARSILIPVVILAVAFGIFWGFVQTKPEAVPVRVSEKAWLVDVETVRVGDWTPHATLYGRVESLWSSRLTAGVTADVQLVRVIEGDRVEQGDLLVSLDDRDARLVLAQREAELREAQAGIRAERIRHQTHLESLPRERKLLELAAREVSRLSDLVKKQVGAQSALDSARQAAERQEIAVAERENSVREFESTLAELQAREARAAALVEQARLDVERCQVVAPFAGRVTSVLIAPGKRVRSGDALVELYDVDAMVVRAQIPTRYLPAVASGPVGPNGLKVKGPVDGQEVVARLLQLSGAVAEATGGVEALFRFEDVPATLQQGRFLQLDLVLPPQDGLIALPAEAVYGSDRVYRLDDAMRMRPVRVQRVGETQTEDGRQRLLVRSDALATGDRVVVTQLPNAIDGLLVRLPQESQGPRAATR